MASIIPFNRKTRSSSLSPQIASSPSRRKRQCNSEGECRAKRRMFYPDDNPSPAKRTRRGKTQPETETSPVKVQAKSFYGRKKGTYLTPLDRKELDERRRRKSAGDSVATPTEILQLPPDVHDKSEKKTKGKKTQVSSQPKKCKTPLKEIDHLAHSPLKNKKAELRVYSPSRKNQKFFKSRRSGSNTIKQAAVVQKRRGLQVTYKPQGISNKPKESSDKPALFPHTKFVVPNLPRRSSEGTASPKPSARNSSPAPRTRSSPRKATPVRQVISSSKNPDSPNLFSPSDWDFGEEDDAEEGNDSAFHSLDESTTGPESKDITTAKSAEEATSTEDNLQLLTEPCEVSSGRSSPQSVGTENISPEEMPEGAKAKKVYDIFHGIRTRGTSDTSSARSSPRNSPREDRRSKRMKTLRDKDGKEQMTLDFGQTITGPVQCESCGMTYNYDEPSDQLTHSKYHQQFVSALKFPGWKKENVLQRFADGSRIIMVKPDEKGPMKKVQAVKDVVDEDLGFVVDSSYVASHSKTFMYISEDQRVIGFCVAQTIARAYRAIPEKASSPNKRAGVRPWCCSTKPQKAICGINRIWVVGTERRRQVATKLLDCIRATFVIGCPLHRKDLAFTDPTPDGRNFATKYTGTSSFLVYKQ